MSHPFFPTNAEPDERAGIVFFEALKLPPDEHEAFLNHECGSDESLLSEVAGLLRDHGNAGSFLSGEAPAATGLETAIARLTPEETGGKIGPYKLLQQIGEGGCGVVFMAEQEEPVRRRVAVKVIKLGMDTKQVIARFEAERQALALMDHPNIAKVLDAGATDAGRPYFVMELVRGIRITDYCDQNNLPTEARLGLFTQVCQAIQHAHQKGIIHRDIKPSNILVTLHDGEPVPKVIDFGIAKATTGQRLTDKTIFTAFEQFIGTPAYMSPEQAEMSGLDIDTRSDIYALGVLLYELLTGQTPFDARELLASGLDAMRRTIREQEPPRPSTRLSTMLAADLTAVARHHQSEAVKLTHSISGDLDWIVMKALEKDRTRRYETANGLAQDIQRHLNDEPVTARPPNNLYRFQKLVRRNKLAFAAGAGIAAALVAGIAVSTWQAFRANRGEARATSALSELRASAPAFAAMARTLVAGEKFDEAIGKLDIAIKLRPDIPEYILTKADALRGLPNLKFLSYDFEDNYGRALQTAEEFWNGKLPVTAGSLAREGKFTEAEKLLREQGKTFEMKWIGVGAVVLVQGDQAAYQALCKEMMTLGKARTETLRVCLLGPNSGVPAADLEALTRQLKLRWNSDSTAQSITADSAGNLYVVGRGTRPVGSARPRQGTRNSRIVRKGTGDGPDSFRSVDEFELEPDHGAFAYGVSVDAFGNVHVTGFAGSTVGSYVVNHWITRRLPAGSGGTWATTDHYYLSPSNTAVGYNIVADSAGNVFAAGLANNGTSDHYWVVRRQLAPLAP